MAADWTLELFDSTVMGDASGIPSALEANQYFKRRHCALIRLGPAFFSAARDVKHAVAL
jgi:hypothetical protein